MKTATPINTVKKVLSVCALTLAVATAVTPAYAEYSAADEITVLQGFKPGGGSDALAQLTQPYLSKILGVNFVNQYIPGATGAIAWTQLAKQSPKDGATISVTNSPMVVTDYIMNKAIQYDISELTPIANIVTDPGILVVNSDSPYKTLDDFLAAAKKNPGRITVANSGVGGDDYFSTILFERAAKVSLKKVPFQGDGPSYTAALGGKVDASSNNLSTVYGQIKSGNLRPLAVYSEQRLDVLPDVPTLKEKGIDVVAGSSRGYSAPAGIPEKAKQQLIAAIEQMGKDPDFQQAAKKQALNIDIKTGNEYQQMLEHMEKEYSQIWNDVKDEVQR